MNVTLLSYEDGGGGAGRAALKLHRALLDNGIASRLRVAAKRTDSSSVFPHDKLGQRVAIQMGQRLSPRFMRLQRSPNADIHSPSLFCPPLARELNESDADIVQLNWICGLLSIEDIGRLRKPLVWRLSDMWAFSGAEHYGDDGPNARWKAGYRADNRPASHGGLDIDRWLWNRKRRAWGKPIHIVAPSRWLADCVRQSALMRGWPVSVIPTVLDIRQYQPWPKALARQVLGLPTDRRLILFGALAGGTPRKGRPLLEAALARIAQRHSDVAGVIFGQSEPVDPPRLGLPLHWLGHLSDDVTLSLAYSAADVMALPSLQDNLPQTGVEAQGCGCPVVTFDTSGLPDVLEHEKTGYLAKTDADSLAHGIEWVLGDPDRLDRLSRQARQRAVALWAPAVVVAQYRQVYEHAMTAQAKSE
jgi:glycosyltransferase involved in cell wall biosynthesis